MNLNKLLLNLTLIIIIIFNFIFTLLISGCNEFTGNKTPKLIGNSKWDEISADMHYTCGIDTNKSIKCSGTSDFLSLSVDTLNKTISSSGEINKWKLISTAYNNACAISNEGQLWCWGDNTSGQLGVDDLLDNEGSKRSIPPVKVNDDKWKSVFTKGKRTCGIKSDNTLWCWGYGSVGQLGIGHIEHENKIVKIPKQVGNDYWNKIALGSAVSCGLKQDNTLWCWGKTEFIYENMYKDFVLEPELLTEDKFIDIAIGNNNGGYSICGIKEDDTLWCWGSNNSGQLGNGSQSDSDIPVQVGNDKWKTVSTGWNYTCGIKDDNSLWCWGNNYYFKLGDGTEELRTKPKKITDNSDWLKISLGKIHTCGIKNDKSLWCWGSNRTRQINIKE